MKHLHIWRCLPQARPYVPKERKLDSKKISCYFVGYSKKSWGFKFYDPSARSIFETGNTHFFEDIEFDRENKVRNTNIKEEYNDSVNTEDNLILSNIQESVSCPSTSYSKISYPQEEVSSRELIIKKGSQISNNFHIYL